MNNKNKLPGRTYRYELYTYPTTSNNHHIKTIIIFKNRIVCSSSLYTKVKIRKYKPQVVKLNQG